MDHGLDYRLNVNFELGSSILKKMPLKLTLTHLQAVMEECYKNGKDPPPYCLEALIGKGSFGRVYKGFVALQLPLLSESRVSTDACLPSSKNMRSAQVVAVKIIDIDESDSVQPRQADAYSEFLKEINALALLNETKARNINHVIEALDVGKAMWLITDYCGGGSVASLVSQTSNRSS